MTAPAQIRSETVYDALIDGWSLVLRVLAQPCTLQELAAHEGLDAAVVEKRLVPIERAGIIRRAGDRFEAVASAIYTPRLEGMVSGLSRYVLPLVTQVVEKRGDTLALQLDLDLQPAEQEALRSGLVQDLLNDLHAITDEPAARRATYTAVIVGSSDVPPAGEAGERALETVRRCARQRSDPERASRAVLTYFDGLIGFEHVERAEAAVRRAASRLEHRVVHERKPAYTIFVAFGRRDAGQGEGR